MWSLGVPVRECESCCHNPQNEGDGHLNNDHRVPLDNTGVPGREARHATRVAVWEVFRWEDIWEVVRTSKSTKRPPA